MEPPNKRRRIGENILDESDDDDELSFLPEEASARKDPEFRLSMHRAKAESKLQSAMENIFAKYERSFEGVGDEVDMMTGEVLVDNGHLKKIRKRRDILPALRQDDEDDDDEDNSEDDESQDPSDSDEQYETAKETSRRYIPKKKKNPWRLPEDLPQSGAEPPPSAFQRTAFRGHVAMMRGSPMTAPIVVRRAHMRIPHRKKTDVHRPAMSIPVMSGALHGQGANHSLERPRSQRTEASYSALTSATSKANRVATQRSNFLATHDIGILEQQRRHKKPESQPAYADPSGVAGTTADESSKKRQKTRKHKSQNKQTTDLTDADEHHDGDISEFVHENTAPKPKRPLKRRKKAKAGDWPATEDFGSDDGGHVIQESSAQSFGNVTDHGQQNDYYDGAQRTTDMPRRKQSSGKANRRKTSAVSNKRDHNSMGTHDTQPKISRVISYTTKIPLRPAHDDENTQPQPSLEQRKSTLPDVYEADGETTQVEDEGPGLSDSDGTYSKRRSGRSRRQTDQFGRISWLQVRTQERAEKKRRALQRTEDARLRREKRDKAKTLPQSRLMWTVKSPCLRRISELIPEPQAASLSAHSGGRKTTSGTTPARKRGRPRKIKPPVENMLSDEEAPIPLAKKAPERQPKQSREPLDSKRQSNDTNVAETSYSGARFAVRNRNINPLTGKRVYVQRRPPTINPLTGRRIYVRKKPLSLRAKPRSRLHGDPGKHQPPVVEPNPVQLPEVDSDATITDPEMMDDVQDDRAQLATPNPTGEVQHDDSALQAPSHEAPDSRKTLEDAGKLDRGRAQDLSKPAVPRSSSLLLPKEAANRLTLTPIQEVLRIIPDAVATTREHSQRAAAPEPLAVPSAPSIQSQRNGTNPTVRYTQRVAEDHPASEIPTNRGAMEVSDARKDKSTLPAAENAQFLQDRSLTLSQLPSSIPNSTSTASPFPSQSLPPSSPSKTQATSLPPKSTPQKRKLSPFKHGRADRTPSRSPMAGSPAPSSNRSILSMVSEDEEESMAWQLAREGRNSSVASRKSMAEPGKEASNTAVRESGSPQLICGRDGFMCGKNFCFTCGSSKRLGKHKTSVGAQHPLET